MNQPQPSREDYAEAVKEMLAAEESLKRAEVQRGESTREFERAHQELEKAQQCLALRQNNLVLDRKREQEAKHRYEDAKLRLQSLVLADQKAKEQLAEHETRKP